MKKLLSALLVFALLFSVVACGNGDNKESPASVPANSETSAASEAGSPSPSQSAAPGNSTTPAPSASPSSNLTATESIAPPEEGTKFKEHIEVIWDQSSSVINVHSIAGGGQVNVSAYMMIHAALVMNSATGGESYPWIASSWETDDYITWIFHLRDDVYFHNGDKVTAEDVVWTYNEALKNVGSQAYNIWAQGGYITDVKALDDYTVQMDLSVPYFEGYRLVGGAAGACILSKRAIEEDGEKGQWIGAGPWKITGFSTNDYITFERNDDYFGELPYTKTMTWKYIPEGGSRTIMMENGEADLAVGIPMTDLEIFRSNPKYGIVSAESNGPVSIMFNLADPVCNDWNFRMAVASAIDREMIVALSGNLATAMSEDEASVWGKVTPYRDTDIRHVPYDLDKAREYLAASLYDGTPIELTAMTQESRTAEAIQWMLKEIGLDITLNIMEMASLFAYTGWGTTDSQMVFWTATFGLTPTRIYANTLCDGGINNRMNYVNPELEELTASTVSITDEDVRKATLYRMQEIIAEDMPLIPVFWIEQAVVTVAGFEGVVIGAMGTFDFVYAYVPEG